MIPRRVFKSKEFPCTWPGCKRAFVNPTGRQCHITTVHRRATPPPAPTLPTMPASLEAPRTPSNTRQFQETHTPNFYDEFDPDYGLEEFGSPGPGNGASNSSDLAEGDVPESRRRTETHPHLTGTPCDVNGDNLPDGAIPPPPDHPANDDWFPFQSASEFKLADFLYHKEQMSANKIDELLTILSEHYKQSPPPFADHTDLYNLIDGIEKGDAPWQSFTISYSGDVPDSNPPPWMSEPYQVWFRNLDTVLSDQLSNPGFAKEMDFAPKRVYDEHDKREYKDFMSGNWSWRQADTIYQNDPSTAGAALVAVLLGSDKTTTSVATGNHEYYPLYASTGSVHNSVRRSHRNAVSLAGFLSIQKTDKQYAADKKFRSFRQQLFHSSLHQILLPLKDAMSTPVIRRCADGHYCRIIYSIGPYIADYPEQALLACIVQGWCAHCYAPGDDLEGVPNPLLRSEEHRKLLQQIKDPTELWDEYGIVSDVIIIWLTGWFEYIEAANTPADARKILADIDHRISCVPSFPGLRRFNHGRGFKQWTGDDSKALMKVFLPAISRHVPHMMIQALSSFLEFCYLVRRSVINEDCLHAIQQAISDFHRHRVVFQNVGVRAEGSTGFNLPRQHSIRHCPELIREFGAPNGLCSSITESKHIKAVKEPYRRTNRYNEMAQMLLINQRMDKLAAASVDFANRGMLDGDMFLQILPQVPSAGSHRPTPVAENDQGPDVFPSDAPKYLGEVTLARTRARRIPSELYALAEYFQQPQLPRLLRQYLFESLNPDSEVDSSQIPLDQLPIISSKINIYSSASATFFAPSDMCGTGGMLTERIRSCRSWQGGPPRCDCVFAERDPDIPGFRGLYAARVLLFLSFEHSKVTYPCALVHWYSTDGDEPCPATRMWRVKPDVDGRRQ